MFVRRVQSTLNNGEHLKTSVLKNRHQKIKGLRDDFLKFQGF